MDKSGLSTFEYISIVGHYNKLTLDSTIDPRLLSKGYSEQALELMRSKIGKLPSEILSLDVHFKCGIETINYDQFGYTITMFDAYDKHGILPFPGSFSEQPAKIIEIFQVLDQLKGEHEKKQHEERQREQNKTKPKKRR